MTQVTEAPARTRAQITERTLRGHPWWRAPVVTALLCIWVAYAAVRVLTGHWYYVPAFHYPTPFYSPCVSGGCVPGPGGLGHWLPAVPPVIPYALVSLPFALGFRLSCHSRWRTAGGLRHLSGHPARYRARAKAPWLNGRRTQPARTAPGTLMPAGLYIKLAAGLAVSDLRFLN
jgi:hypothetical protein